MGWIKVGNVLINTAHIENISIREAIEVIDRYSIIADTSKQPTGLQRAKNRLSEIYDGGDKEVA